MNERPRTVNMVLSLLIFAVMACLVACEPLATDGTELPEAPPRAWIDFPRDGAEIPVGASVIVVSHAYAADGVAEVLLSVNGTAYRRDLPAAAGDTLVEVRQEWIPTKPGLHTLEARAYDGSGAISGSGSITVRVTGDAIETPTEVATSTPTPTPTLVQPPTTVGPTDTRTPTPPTRTPTSTIATRTPTPTLITRTPTPTMITATPTPTNVPPPEVTFWVDDDTITAGACTMIHWETQGAATVTLNGMDVTPSGSVSVCPETTTTYTIHAEGAGGTVDQSLTVNVSAPADTTPPPVPEPFVPADELVIACSFTQMLAWLPVSDPSGVVYYVRLEQQVTTSSWNPVDEWGPLEGKQVEADVQCGLIYRWSVRAQDGAGNASAWSEWSAFSVNLE